MPASVYCATLLLLASALPARYAGTWSLIPDESDPIRPAIDKAVSRMNLLIRGIARSRLAKTQLAFPTVTISNDGNEIRIRHDGGTDVSHRDTATPVKTKSPDGSPIVVRLDPGPPLSQTYEASDGSRRNTYVLSPDAARLTLDVLVTSPRLPEPLQYKLVYERAR